MDLALLDSIDPAELSSELARVHMLDHGRTRYEAQDLWTFVHARDGGCRAPDCTVRHGCEVDHATRFPDGPTSAANLGLLSTTCHQLKTDGHITMTDSAADGSCTWLTAWGQRVHIPARAFLDDPPPPDEDLTTDTGIAAAHDHASDHGDPVREHDAADGAGDTSTDPDIPPF